MNIFSKSIIVLMFAFSLAGCSDFFNPDPSSTLIEKDYIGSYTELFSGLMGVASKVQAVADKGIFLEGLRGDFLEPTSNATQEMWDIYNYKDIARNNSLADPKDYYDVVINANDYLAHAFAYHAKNPNAVDTATFKAYIGGAIRFKVWAYLMLAKIYGEAVYFDDPLGNFQDISKYPVLKFDDIITKCVALMEIGVNGINGKGVVKWSSIISTSPTTADTEWDRICPAPEILLAELYLWQNNYQVSFNNCLKLITDGGLDGYCYQINLSEYNGEWKGIFNHFIRKEHVAAAFYDYNLKQTNHIIEYFSNLYPNKYYLAPTKVAMDRFMNQKKPNGSLGDLYRGENITFKLVNNQYVVEKYIYGFETSDKIYRNDIIIPLYRSSDAHLLMSEALVGLGRYEEALAFLNLGIESYYNSLTGTFNSPFAIYPTTLFLPSGDRGNAGVRGRVALGAVGSDILASTTLSDNEKKLKIDSLLVEESSLELAGESKAYYAMLRMAKRWGSTVQSQWAGKVAAKYPDGGSEIKTKLEDDINNWFIKFDLK